jgi:hypothetical protein
VSKVFYQKYPNQRPKPRAKDPLVELRKQLRREEMYQKLVDQLGETEITRKDTHSKENAFSHSNLMDIM